jgi:hypothetical protein
MTVRGYFTCFLLVPILILLALAMGVMSDHNARAFGGRENLPQICRHSGFRFLSRWRDLQGDNVACVCTPQALT